MTEIERDETPEGFRVESLDGVQIIYYRRPVLEAATLEGVRRRALAGPADRLLLDVAAAQAAGEGAVLALAALCEDASAAGKRVAVAMPMGPLFRQTEKDPDGIRSPICLMGATVRHYLDLDRLPEGYAFPPDTEPWFTEEEMAEAMASESTIESLIAELEAKHGPA